MALMGKLVGVQFPIFSNLNDSCRTLYRASGIGQLPCSSEWVSGDILMLASYSSLRSCLDYVVCCVDVVGVRDLPRRRCSVWGGIGCIARLACCY